MRACAALPHRTASSARRATTLSAGAGGAASTAAGSAGGGDDGRPLRLRLDDRLGLRHDRRSSFGWPAPARPWLRPSARPADGRGRGDGGGGGRGGGRLGRGGRVGDHAHDDGVAARLHLVTAGAVERDDDAPDLALRVLVLGRGVGR
ncbi:MAG: hypothetical protein MZV64_14690 [Ignavibacteriales bacterium]|nr:hypothetical protein [Ignavibacteriales bacterium]